MNINEEDAKIKPPTQKKHYGVLGVQLGPNLLTALNEYCHEHELVKGRLIRALVRAYIKEKTGKDITK